MTARVWMLMCEGVAAGSYTDHCERPFAAGDVLRDDQCNRRMVIACSSNGDLTLDVSSPDDVTTSGNDVG